MCVPARRTGGSPHVVDAHLRTPARASRRIEPAHTPLQQWPHQKHARVQRGRRSGREAMRRPPRRQADASQAAHPHVRRTGEAASHAAGAPADSSGCTNGHQVPTWDASSDGSRAGRGCAHRSGGMAAFTVSSRASTRSCKRRLEAAAAVAAAAADESAVADGPGVAVWIPAKYEGRRTKDIYGEVLQRRHGVRDGSRAALGRRRGEATRSLE